MTRHTTFCFTLLPDAEQGELLRRHIGAARFAYNQSLRLVLDALEAKKENNGERVPWSGFDLINAFNRWKRSRAAGIDDEGREGLSWRAEVCQQVFEEAAVDLGRALEAISAFRKGDRSGKRPGFPRFKNKTSPRQSFRIRNKISAKGRSAVRLGEVDAPSLTLPKIGAVRVREGTRKLRRMLRRGQARILFATVSMTADRFRVSLNVEASPLHPACCHPPGTDHVPVGVDRGLSTFAVVADAEGRELDRVESPRPFRAALPKLRKRSREVTRKQKGSRNRGQAKRRLSRLHQRIGNIRRDFVHRASSRLAKTHGQRAEEAGGVLRQVASYRSCVPGLPSFSLSSSPEGIGCVVCHLRGGAVLTSRPIETKEHPTRFEPLLSDARFCAGCHQFRFERSHGAGAELTEHVTQDTWREWRASGASGCKSCHMESAGHRFPGAHDLELLRSAIEVTAHPGEIEIRASAGHHVPTGDLFRHLTVEVETTLEWREVARIGRRFEVDAIDGVHAKRMVEDTSLAPGASKRFEVRGSRWRVVYRYTRDDAGVVLTEGPIIAPRRARSVSALLRRRATDLRPSAR